MVVEKQQANKWNKEKSRHKRENLLLIVSTPAVKLTGIRAYHSCTVSTESQATEFLA